MSAVRAAVLHPVTLGALALLVINDHLFKWSFPGVVTGKLSDAAGLAFFPVVLAFVLRGRSARAVALAAAATAVAFSAVKLAPFACDLYATWLGRAQWLARVPGWLARGVAAPSPAPAIVARDASDLACLPFALVGVALARRAESGAKQATHCAADDATQIMLP